MSTPIDRLNIDLDNLYNIKALHIETVEDLLAIYSMQKDPLEPLVVTSTIHISESNLIWVYQSG